MASLSREMDKRRRQLDPDWIQIELGVERVVKTVEKMVVRRRRRRRQRGRGLDIQKWLGKT